MPVADVHKPGREWQLMHITWTQIN
jgi:hypothetical protein